MRGPRAAAGIDHKEIEANQFAASLLMPESVVREQVRLVAADRPLDDIDVSLLARQFMVSEQAITIRLSTLGLL
jgi:Zn-dependent peptidase ImmA (M78 family)